jgi:hypothetical protein
MDRVNAPPSRVNKRSTLVPQVEMGARPRASLAMLGLVALRLGMNAGPRSSASTRISRAVSRAAARRRAGEGSRAEARQVLPPMRDTKRDIILTVLGSVIADRTTPLSESEFVWSISF